MDDDTLEAKCENLMTVVVESRKRFSKMCRDYNQKCSMMENKILNLKIETASNCQYKPKHSIPEIDTGTKEIEDFAVELFERKKRIEELRDKVKNTQAVVLQLKRDKVGGRLRQPVDSDVMLANAKRCHKMET